MATRPRAVLVVEDHPLFAESVLTLARRVGLERFQLAPTLEAATALLPSLDLDDIVAVVDVQLADGSGLELIRRWAPSGLRALVLTGSATAAHVRAALAAGARGFVSKTDCPVIVGRAIEAVARGETFLSRSVQLLLDEAPGVDLTPRETEVLRWVGHGMTNKEIAQKLGLAVRTVESHRERLMTKLDAHNAADLTRAAIKRGLASA